MKRVLFILLILASVIMLSACASSNPTTSSNQIASSNAFELSSHNYNEVITNIDKYKDKNVQYQGTIAFPSNDKKIFTVLIGSNLQAITEVTSKNDVNTQNYSTIKVTGKILGKKNDGLQETIAVEAEKVEVLKNFYDITGLVSDKIAITTKDYPELVSNLDKHVNEMAELEGEVSATTDNEDNLYTYSMSVTGYVTPTTNIVTTKPLELNQGEPTVVKVQGVIKKYPIDDSPVIIATNVEKVPSTSSSDSANSSDSVNSTQSPSGVDSTSTNISANTPSNTGGDNSADLAQKAYQLAKKLLGGEVSSLGQFTKNGINYYQFKTVTPPVVQIIVDDDGNQYDAYEYNSSGKLTLLK